MRRGPSDYPHQAPSFVLTSYLDRILGTMRQQLARCMPLAGSAPISLQVGRQRHTRFLATAAKNGEPTTASLDSRWLSDLRTRIGKCIMFGLNPEQAKKASLVLQEMALDWRGLVAGSEGFLTEQSRRGLDRQAVVWGEMVLGPSPRSSPLSAICIIGNTKLTRDWGRNRIAW